MSFLMYLYKKRGIIIVISVVFAVLFFLTQVYNTAFSSSMIISLIYQGSEQGLYPDSTRLNIYDVIDDSVLDEAVESYNAEVDESRRITKDDVQNRIRVYAKTENDLIENIQEARENGENYSFFINEFSIGMEPVHKFSPNTAFGIFPYIDSDLLLQKVYDSYANMLVQEHAEGNVIPTLAQNLNYEGYDYLEYSTTLRNQINTYINYLENKNMEHGSFVSPTTGMSFNDLINEFNNMISYQITNFESFVSSSHLARNTEEYINILATKNEMDRITYQKLYEESVLARSAMSEYDHTFEENIVITMIGEEKGLYQARPKTDYDTISQRALDQSVAAEEVNIAINDRNQKIAEYTNTEHSPEERERLVGIADDMIESMQASAAELIEKADASVDDYLREKSSDYITGNINDKNYFAPATLIGTFAVLIAAAAVTSVVLLIYSKVKYRMSVNMAKKRGKMQQREHLRNLSQVNADTYDAMRDTEKHSTKEVVVQEADTPEYRDVDSKRRQQKASAGKKRKKKQNKRVITEYSDELWSYYFDNDDQNFRI